nr:hypothetical protein [Litchfieldia alkalitelluris]
MKEKWRNVIVPSLKKGKWLTVVVWIVAVGLLSAIFPSADSEKNEKAEVFLKETESMKAEKLLEEEFRMRMAYQHCLLGTGQRV